VTKAGSSILTPKQYNIAWDGIMLHLQRTKRPEPYHGCENYGDRKKMSMQFTMFKHPRNCDVHFMTNAH
jgi:hypothetical protein